MDYAVMRYRRLSQEEREKIHASVHEGMSKRSIAKELERSHSTIVRELKRGKPGEYSPSKAHEDARRRDCNRGRKKIIETHPETLVKALSL